MPQPRPDGIEWDVTDEWLQWVEQRMAEIGISQRGLAERIVEAGGQATGTAISDLLLRKTPRSRLVPWINAALGGPVPYQRILDHEIAVDAVKARIDAKYPLLDEEGRRLILQLMEQLTRDR